MNLILLVHVVSKPCNLVPCCLEVLIAKHRGHSPALPMNSEENVERHVHVYVYVSELFSCCELEIESTTVGMSGFGRQCLA